MHKMRAATFTALIGTLLLWGGCSDDKGRWDIPGSPVTATSAEEVLEYFQQAYTAMDAEILDRILAPDFRLNLEPETLTAWAGTYNPLTTDFFDRDAMLEMSSRLVFQFAGSRPDGEVLAPVVSIAVPLLEQLTHWQPLTGGSLMAGDVSSGKTARFALFMDLELADDSHISVAQTLDLAIVRQELNGEFIYRLHGLAPVETWTKADITGQPLGMLLSHFRTDLD